MLSIYAIWHLDKFTVVPGGPRRGGGGGGGGQLPDWDQLQPRPGPDIPDGDDGFFLFSCLICEISGCVVSL